jgi:hypothetical protein
MNLIDQILTTKELIAEPPILLDIGASGQIDHKWEILAKYSVCIAFDADDREMGYLEKESSIYKKLYVYNCIVSDNQKSELDFYLTKSPYCSSLLEPYNEALEDYAFAPLFQIEKKIKIKNIELKSAIQKLNINYIDWFKTDSQGTDLRLFLNLGDDIINRILVAEFEPGIIDAYQGEDKLHTVMACLEHKNFWISAINIKGSQRINPKNIELYFNNFEKNYLHERHIISPGWGEVTFFNKNYQKLNKRDLLLFWVFSMIEKQYGFALEIAQQGKITYSDAIFDQMIKESLKKFKNTYQTKSINSFLKRAIIKLLRIIDK